ncbi:cytochrome P450 [Irpex lacteus]|nr:cytochrome P450 [Irpex lacteus]
MVDAYNRTVHLISEVIRGTPSRPGTVITIGAVTWIVYWYLRRRRALPGPPRLPLLGNLLQVPLRSQFIPYTDWSRKYVGPIYSLNLLGRETIILNNFEVAGDLLDRCSNIYNSRPYQVMMVEVLCGGTFMPLETDMERWRRWRRASHDTFGPKGVEKFRSAQTEAAVLAMLRIIENPAEWEHHIQVFTASGIFSAVYGWAPLPASSPHVEPVYELAKGTANASIPGAYFVDIFPIMKHLPAWMAGWKRKGMAWHERISTAFEAFNADIADKMTTGEAPVCYASELLQTEHRHGFTRKETAWTSAVMVAAGAETTATTIAYFVLAMLNYPDVMRKAQVELDAVVGRERIPTSEDADNLPYICAMVRETLRWRPASPLGMSIYFHPAMNSDHIIDNWYNGYFIPKGKTMMTVGASFHANSYVDRDPSIFPDFDVYRPERFLDGSGKILVTPPGAPQMGHTSFGFGRRICIGMHFAEQALFIGIVTLLWALNIEPAIGENGEQIIPRTDAWIDVGTVVRPVPFQCRFSPRSAHTKAILRDYTTS